MSMNKELINDGETEVLCQQMAYAIIECLTRTSSDYNVELAISIAERIAVLLRGCNVTALSCCVCNVTESEDVTLQE